MKDLDNAKRILGIDIKRDRKNKTLLLSQSAYLLKVLRKFVMHESKSVTTPLCQHIKCLVHSLLKQIKVRLKWNQFLTPIELGV